jgi:adenylate cyclase
MRDRGWDRDRERRGIRRQRWGRGYKDFTALGDVTNTAARLSSVAAAGEILVNSTTYEDLSDRYSGAERRVLDLKGKSGPVVVYAISVS